MNIRDALTYDDIMLEPKYSEIESRSLVDTSVELPKGFRVKHPIVPSNMKTIIGYEMGQVMLKSGGMIVLHRFMPLADQVSLFKRFDPSYLPQIGVSVGVKEEDKSAIDRWADLGAQIICIDVAHGHSKLCRQMCQYIANKHPKMLLIAGNTATAEGALMLWEAGADIVKQNVGSGSICSTRIETGNGIPALTSLMDAATVRGIYGRNCGWKIMADGGARKAGDFVKGLCFADLVMTGNTFAGAEETPGQLIQIDGKYYKEYVGSSTHKSSHIEGVMAIVPTKGRAEDILRRLLEGIKSGCSYQGCANLEALKKNPKFVRVSNAGLIESQAHDVIVR